MDKGRGKLTIELHENDIAYHKRKIREHREAIAVIKKLKKK